MTTKRLPRVIVLAAAALLGSAATCQAQVSWWRTSYSYDRFGRMVAARIDIALPAVNRRYVFVVPAAFFRLPVKTQVILLDQRVGLGDDADAVSRILESLRQSRQQQEDMRRQQDMMRQQQNLLKMSQPPVVIPQAPIPQPPIRIPRGPGMAPLSIPQAPIPQAPIYIPR